MVVRGEGRDLRTDRDGATRVLARAHLEVELDPAYRIRRFESSPGWSPPGGLDRVSVASGFRKLLRGPRGPGADDQLLTALLDDLPGASLVGGYAAARRGSVPVRPVDAQLGGRLDVCAGFARGASIDLLTHEQGVIPLPAGEPLTIEAEEDLLAWHERRPLVPDSMRRQRLMDVQPDAQAGRVRVAAHFRDIHTDADGRSVVVHEYVAEVAVDLATGRVASVEVTARVLPWPECPGAVVTAQQAVGQSLTELRARMTGDFVGPSSCTHLTDTVRAIGHLDAVVEDHRWTEGADEAGR